MRANAVVTPPLATDPIKDEPVTVAVDESSSSASSGVPPVRGRVSSRPAKPKIDPDFKYLSAGPKKQGQKRQSTSSSLNGSVNHDEEPSFTPAKQLKPAFKIQKVESHAPVVYKVKNSFSNGFAIKKEKLTPSIAKPRPLAGSSAVPKKRKLKPLKALGPGYVKKRQKQKLDKLSATAPTAYPGPSQPYLKPKKLLQPSVIRQEPMYQQFLQLPTPRQLSSPETILPDDILPDEMGNFSGIGGAGYHGSSFNQNNVESIKDEPIEICDNGLNSSFTLTAGESVLDFSMF